MSIFNALNAAIYSTLAGGTALITTLGGTFIYFQRAPDEAELPYIVWSYMGGGPLNRTPSDLRDALVQVRAFAATSAQAGTIDAQASGLLHHQALAVTGYTNIWTARETDVSNIEIPSNGAAIYSAGAVYRIKLDD